jgi:tRNA (guanine-N7-)-methyltransferase
MTERPKSSGRRQINRFSVEKPEQEIIRKYCRVYTGKDLYWNPEELLPLMSESMFGNDKPLVLDVGCGRGKLVISLGEENPDINYIGIEIHWKSLWDAINNTEERGLNNVKFVRADVRFVMKMVPDESVHEIHLIFPPPITKEKHRKKELVTEGFIREAHRVLESGGILHLVTDHEDYFMEKKEMIDGMGIFEEETFTKKMEGGLTWYQSIWEGHGFESLRVEYKKK